jgi:hypothetical protein
LEAVMGVGVDLGRQAAWRRRLREFERSSETVGEFCDRVGASVSTFYRWQRKLTRRSREYPSTADAPTNPTRTGSPRARASSAASPAMSFLPIAITAAATQLEVLFANGTRVSVPCHDREVIRVVLSSLLAEGTTSAPREDEPC